MAGDNGLSTGREFIDYRYIQIPVEGHGKGAGDGCGGHHQHVRQHIGLFPEPGPLSHPKAVLFIDHYQPEPLELNNIFDHSMGANEDMYCSVEQALVDGYAHRLLHRSGEQFNTDIHSIQKSADTLVMLLGQNLRRSHDTGLEPIVDGNKHRHESHQGFPATHIALQ